MFPFLRLQDGTRVSISEISEKEIIEIYFDQDDGEDKKSKHATFSVPGYKCYDVSNYNNDDLLYFDLLVRDVASLVFNMGKFMQRGYEPTYHEGGIYLPMEFCNASDPICVYYCSEFVKSKSDPEAKFWITRRGRSCLCYSADIIPDITLFFIMMTIDAMSQDFIETWKEHFGEIHYYF